MKIKRNTKLHLWKSNKPSTIKCAKCGIVGSIFATVDHIIPVHILQSLDVNGERLQYEWEENFQYLCGKCNAFKANRLDVTNPKTKILLQKLLDKI